MRTAISSAALVLYVAACDPQVVIGAAPGNSADAGSIADASDGMPGADASSGKAATDAAAPSDAAAGLDAATDAPADAADDAGTTLLWSAAHESGDLSEWEREGGVYGETPSVTDALARSGDHALVFTIDTSDGLDRAARVYRAAVAEAAYYSAWFYLNEDHVPGQWWSIFLFRGQEDPSDIDTAVNLWDVDLVRGAEDQLVLSLYDHLTGIVHPAEEVAVPIAQWVQLEAYFRHEPNQASELAFYLDGALVLELDALDPAPTAALFWSIGNGSNGLSPPLSTIYADDAAISTVRLGP